MSSSEMRLTRGAGVPIWWPASTRVWGWYEACQSRQTNITFNHPIRLNPKIIPGVLKERDRATILYSYDNEQSPPRQ